ncbi:platelet-activating factor acetylhydrolase IB alpha subunit [Aureobasidium pullulans]|uniref:Nuclear distribution protein PAC1 n=1 Tax=Aureobasidium pullulans TaxID=5580 RepID=A0A4S9E6F2_AURPU|nr:platelet-activating factor acetylhydrolase IB alpha subunit [Aureobasidium pullulans]THV91851.1 platelet-activating factor acetylhydrolase IB alpha subunit [Aureobasidium pullulans]THW70035.1 platelet-activating factor acetylhydrolase IB alpha subunit [Aureobasidium pullulans]THX29615.1 platelet-activating factor acetylhydrolase IB alpha subunit [Aureobasidium pullulans]THX30485.1 platelet-activating factor acetylhydrolase IB alpha subunit [Aureobasidium pullulans]
MTNLLTQRQAEELHKSLIAYLTAAGLTNTAQTLREEVNIGDSFDDATRKKYEGLLEKKWTSVVRLQKKIMDLESRNTTLQTELDTATPTSLSRRNQDPATWLPRSPARHTLQSHRQPVTCVAFHPVFSSLASGSEDATIKIWDWELGELERTIKGHTKGVLDIDYGGPRGGTLLASCSSDLTIKLWDPSDEYKNIRTLPGHDHSVSAVRFIPSGAAGAPSSGNLLASASRDKTIRIWDVTTGYCVKTIRGHADWVRDVAPSFDGRWLLSVGNDQTARLWDTQSGDAKVTFVGHEHVIECCTFAPAAAYPHLASMAGLKKAPPATSSAEFVATAGRDKLIKLWDARGTLIKTLVGHDNWVRALLFHPGGKYLLSCADDKTIRCWDLSQEGKCVKTIEDAHGHFVSSMRWAPGVIKDASAANADAANGSSKPDEAAKVSIRCVIATGSVDLNVRVFAA